MNDYKKPNKGAIKIAIWSLMATCLISWSSVDFAQSASPDSIDDEIQSVFKEIDTENKKKKRTARKKRRKKKARLARTLPKKKKITQVNFNSNLNSKAKSTSAPAPIARKKKAEFRKATPPVQPITPSRKAAPVHTVTAPKKRVYKTYDVDEKKSKKYGINVFGFYSTGDKINSTNNSSEDFRTATTSVGEYTSSASFGLGLEHSMEVFRYGPVGLGYQAGSTYEFERTVEIEDTASNNTYYYGNTTSGEYPTMALILPYANLLATYNIGYAFGGVNYSLPQVKSEGNETFAGGIGFQAGVGTNIGKWAAVEALYRWVSFEASPDESSNTNSYYYTNASNYQSGLRISQDETLDFSSFNLILKVRF